jgi:16S rRNA (guanine(966)-N(2))-methyltransferase RsmD
MKVSGGRFKGRPIPFSSKKYGNAESTPQKVKEALFSMLGEDLTGASFLDLFACSGQVGIEALSRGADMVVFNEIERARYLFIRDLVGEWDREQRAVVLHMPSSRCLKYLEKRGFSFDYIFLDPPYAKTAGVAPLYAALIDEIDRYAVTKPGTRIIIQHFASNDLPGRVGGFEQVTSRRYGSSALSIYARADGPPQSDA